MSKNIELSASTPGHNVSLNESTHPVAANENLQSTPAASSPRSSTHLISGFVAGLISAAVLQPFDLLKTRLQQLSANSSNSSIALLLSDTTSLRSLWKGTLPSVLRTSIGSSLYLTSLSLLRNYISKNFSSTSVSTSASASSSSLPKLSHWQNLATGATMRGLVGLATMPFTVIKTRYESLVYHYTSIRQAVSAIIATNGWKGFFLGAGSTLIRDAPYAGIYVLMYEKFKDFIPKIFGVSTSFPIIASSSSNNLFASVSVNTCSAVLAAAIATLITTPFDTIKTRIQISPEKYTNFGTALSLILINEKYTALFKGASLRLARKTLSAAIAWGTYEELVKIL